MARVLNSIIMVISLSAIIEMGFQMGSENISGQIKDSLKVFLLMDKNKEEQNGQNK